MIYEVDYEVLSPTLGTTQVTADTESDAYDLAEKEVIRLYPEADELDIEILEIREID